MWCDMSDQEKLNKLIILFVAAFFIIIGDFISVRILIPKMISSQNDLMVSMGFIWVIILFLIHILVGMFLYIRNKEVKND